MTDLYRCDKCKGVFERQPSFEGYFRPCVMGKNPKVQLCDSCAHKMWRWLEDPEPHSMPRENKVVETIVTTCGTCRWRFDDEFGVKVCRHPDNWDVAISEDKVCKRWEGKE